jgi:beta-barrel assembly-enhancing protease
VIGAIIGGRVGSVVAETTRFGLGTAFLRFSREFERQADIEGAQIMARAGYDPRDMANMFKTIEKQGGSGGPQWLSDHPNPGDRSEYITREAQSLQVRNPIRDTRAFAEVKSHLKGLPRAPTTEEATRGAGRTPSAGESRAPAGNVDPPSSRYSTYSEGNLFRVSVPSNWRELQGTTAVTFAPQGAYGSVNGRRIFTHGVEIGMTRNETHDLRTATDELISSLSRGNPDLRPSSGSDRVTLADRSGLRTVLSNTSEATGRPETIELFTTLLRDSTLFYLIGVSPREESREYQTAFQRIVRSLQISG